MYIYQSTKTNSKFVNVSKKDIEALRVLAKFTLFSQQTKEQLIAFCDNVTSILTNTASINYEFHNDENDEN